MARGSATRPRRPSPPKQVNPPMPAILEGLSPEQQEAAGAPEPYAQVVAVAGAGKTETLTRRILFLLACSADPAASVSAPALR